MNDPAGVTLVFDREEDLLAAVREARAGGREVLGVYTPWQVHGLDEAMGIGPSRLTWVCFAFGSMGCLGALALQFWTSAVAWPIDVGGKPWNSLPAFIPVTFELTVLCAALGTVAVLFVVCGLHPLRRPRHPVPRVTDDRFALVLSECGQRQPSSPRASVAAEGVRP